MGELTRSLLKYVEEVEVRVKEVYGLGLSDIHLPTLADSWREGWSAQEFVDWFAGKYDLLPVREVIEPF